MNRARLDEWVREKEGLPVLNRKTLEELQLRKLNRLLEREQDRKGFYGKLPQRLRSLQELAELPFTDEEDLKRHGPSMVLVSQAEIERVRSWETSGTTGPAKRVFYAAEDNDRTVSFFAAGLSELIGPGSRTMICMPFTGRRGLGELIGEAVERLDAVPLPAGGRKSFGELAEIMDREKPDTYVGPPALLLSLLRLNPGNSVRRALVSGDACPEGILKPAETLLGSRLFPHYGSREMGLGGAVTCPAFQGMHLRENDILAEIVDEYGNVLPEGEWGELVITLTEARAMPLIRYRTGDRARFLPESCPCGCCLRRLDRVSRLGGEREMEELDDFLFRIPQMVDYRAVRTREGLRLKGLVLSPEDAKTVQEALPPEWKGSRLVSAWRQAAPDDVPCCGGKRRIEEEKDE